MAPKHTTRLAHALALVLPVAALAACGGAKVGEAGAAAAGTGTASSCVDTTGDTIKIGLLNSRSGTMAISENTVYDSLSMAADEINAAAGAPAG